MPACLLYVLHILLAVFEQNENEKKKKKENEKIQYRLLNFSQANRIDTYKYTNLELLCDHISFSNVPQCE